MESTDTAKMLRELMYCGYIIYDHILHFYFLGGPDFVVGPNAPPSERNILSVVTVCPFCFVALDLGQLQMKRKFNEEYSMPIVHYSELLAIALGIDPKELSPESHKVKIQKLLDKISL